MPREYDLTALKPFDYQGRSFVEGESFRTGILGFIQLVGTLKAKLDRPPVDVPESPVEQKPIKPVAKKRGRPRKVKA